MGVFVKHEFPDGNKVHIGYNSIKVTDKVTSSLTLVSFERVPLVEYACQIQCMKSLSLTIQKLWTRLKFFFFCYRITEQQSHRQTDRQDKN